MTYDDCAKLPNSIVDFRTVGGKTYYGCTPNPTSPVILGGLVPALAVASKISCEADGQHKWVIGSDGIGRCQPIISIPSTVLNGYTMSEPFSLAPNQHGNFTATTANGQQTGLAFVNNRTVSYQLPTSTPTRTTTPFGH